jgi:Flp pilus assembly CpaE family ATPase
LSRYAGVTGVRYVPMDTDALDAALAAGRTLPEAAPNSPARQALQDLAAALTGRAQPRRRRRLMSRPRG